MDDKMAAIRKHRGAILDIVIVALLGLAVIVSTLFGKPYKRGYFCDDDSIRYPRLEETIPTTLLIVIAFGIALIVVVIVEGVRLFDSSTPRDSYKTVGYRLLRNCYNILGVFFFGAGLNQLAVNCSKYLIGRLRPNFYATCRPSVDCSELPAHQYVIDYECLGDPDAVNVSRLSFPSGHAGLAFYVAIYISVFLHHRMVWQGSVLLRHLLQGILMLLAWYTILTRVHDNMHHPTDVLAGSIIGSLWALFMTNFVIDMRLHNNSSQEEIRVLRQTQIPSQHGPNYV